MQQLIKVTDLRRPDLDFILIETGDINLEFQTEIDSEVKSEIPVKTAQKGIEISQQVNLNQPESALAATVQQLAELDATAKTRKTSKAQEG